MPTVLKSGNLNLLEPSGPVQACNGIALPVFFTYDSVVGIATRYGLDSSGVESCCGQDFPHSSRWDLGPSQLPVERALGLFPGVKQPEHGIDI